MTERPGGLSRTKGTPAGVAGNVGRDGTPMRQWASRSYSASDGRAASSLATDQYGRGSPSTTHAENLSNQLNDAFHAIDKRRTTNSTPVRNRPFTTKVVG
jgi:hypothetical protein